MKGSLPASPDIPNSERDIAKHKVLDVTLQAPKQNSRANKLEILKRVCPRGKRKKEEHNKPSAGRTEDLEINQRRQRAQRA